MLMNNQRTAALNASKANGEAEAKADAKKAEALAAEQALANGEMSQTKLDAAIKSKGEASKAEAEATLISANSEKSELQIKREQATAVGEALGIIDGETITADTKLTKEQRQKLKAGLSDAEKAKVDKLIEEGGGQTLKKINESFPPPKPKLDKDGKPIKPSPTETSARKVTKTNSQQMMERSTQVRSSSSSSRSSTSTTRSNSGYRETQRQTFSAKIDFSNSNAGSDADITRIASSSTSGKTSAAVLNDVSSVLTGVSSSNHDSVLATKASVESSVNMAAGQIDSAVQSAVSSNQSNITTGQDLISSALVKAATAAAYNNPNAMANAIYEAEQASDAITMEVANAEASISSAASEAQNTVMSLASEGASKILTVETKAEAEKAAQKKDGIGDNFNKGLNKLVNGVFNTIASGLVGNGRSPAELNQLGVGPSVESIQNNGVNTQTPALQSSFIGATVALNAGFNANVTPSSAGQNKRSLLA